MKAMQAGLCPDGLGSFAFVCFDEIFGDVVVDCRLWQHEPPIHSDVGKLFSSDHSSNARFGPTALSGQFGECQQLHDFHLCSSLI